MKKYLNLTTGYILFLLGLSIIFFSLGLTIKNLDKENDELKDFIEVQAEQINRCNSEQNVLYESYLKLEEKYGIGGEK